MIGRTHVIFVVYETELLRLMEQCAAMTMSRQNNDVINYRDFLYIKNKTKLSWSIRQSTIYDENKTGNDVFDRISIPKMRQDNNVTYFTRSMLKTKLSCND